MVDGGFAVEAGADGEWCPLRRLQQRSDIVDIMGGLSLVEDHVDEEAVDPLLHRLPDFGLAVLFRRTRCAVERIVVIAADHM